MPILKISSCLWKPRMIDEMRCNIPVVTRLIFKYHPTLASFCSCSKLYKIATGKCTHCLTSVSCVKWSSFFVGSDGKGSWHILEKLHRKYSISRREVHICRIRVFSEKVRIAPCSMVHFRSGFLFGRLRWLLSILKWVTSMHSNQAVQN